MLSCTEVNEDYVYQWLMEIGEPTTPDEEIRGVPNRLKRLDAKFRACLTDILEGEMPREINLSIDETKKSEIRILKRAEIYRFIARYYRTQEDMGVAHTIADMSKVKFSGDNNLRGFMNTWRKVCNGSKSIVPEPLREEMFREEIRKSEVMAIDVKHYLRMKSEGDRKANRM